MPRTALLVPVALLAALSLAACTSGGSSPDPASTPSGSAGTSGGTSGGALPSCDDVSLAVADLITGLTYNEAVSSQQTAPEAYEQRVCVYTSEDGASQVGVTIAAIPFLETELEVYAQMPGTIADERIADGSAVLQTLRADDAADGHLDSALYLFDLTNSITVQGLTTAGDAAAALPQLTVPAAIEAAFAVRGLL